MAPETPVEEVLELDTGPLAAGGGCVARTDEGQVVFVRHAIPGERVRAAVTARTGSYLRADAVAILDPSPDRVDPPCPHAGAGRCGGCDLQHIAPAAQRRLKAARVAEQLSHGAGVSLPGPLDVEEVPGGANGLGWRTRVRLGVDDRGRAGYRRHRSHQLLAVSSCPITHDALALRDILSARWPARAELAVAANPASGRRVMELETARRVAPPTLPVEAGGLVVNGVTAAGEPDVHVQVAGAHFRISPGVFWQAHVGAPDVLVHAVRRALGARPGDAVADLYAGAGLFAVVLAADVGPDGSVVAVERSAAACADAAHNGRGHPHLSVQRATVTARLVTHDIGRPDLLVLDPTRTGAGIEVMQAIGDHARTIRRVAYVSCDTASFARDIRVLSDRGWTMPELRVFDLFPMTEHVELVATLVPPG
jgi:tRNA/tmRNA/rRNA uracil-C5-methylase (TrmA/RlmC/RlmD family)